MANQNDHRRPDGYVETQHAADMGGAPDVLHRKMSGMQTILHNNREMIAF